jgi:hypothetical protein
MPFLLQKIVNLLPYKHDAFYALAVSVCRKTDEIHAVANCAGIIRRSSELNRMPSLSLLYMRNPLNHSSARVHDLQGNVGLFADVIPNRRAEHSYLGTKRGR